MRPKSVVDEQRQLALALELSKQHAATVAEEKKGSGRRKSRVGTRILFYFVFLFTEKLRHQPKLRVRRFSEDVRAFSECFRRLSEPYVTSVYVVIENGLH